MIWSIEMEILVDEILNDGVHRWSGSIDGKAWTLFCGNAAAALSHIPDESVHCIITSPPYYSLRDYGVDGQIGLEDTVNEYVMSLCGVMDQLYRVLRKDGLLFLNLGDTYYSGKGASHGKDSKSHKRRFGLRPVDKSGGLGENIERKSIIGIPWRVAIEMTSRKWVLRAPIIWHRDKALPESVRDRPHRSYEYIFMFAKDRKYYFNRQPLVDMAYEWDNYRLTTQVMNGYKGDKIVLDPFEIKNGDLVIDFPSCLVKPRKDMTPAEKSKAKATIQILHLNDEDQANRRCEIVMEYICGNISQAFLESKYPFIAEELQRQDLYEKIKEIIKVPVTTPA